MPAEPPRRDSGWSGRPPEQGQTGGPRAAGKPRPAGGQRPTGAGRTQYPERGSREVAGRPGSARPAPGPGTVPGTAPALPPGAQASLLDSETRGELATLGDVALVVGDHLAAAGMLIDEDPEAALVHVEYARRRAPRSAVVREALGLTAYAAGRYELARAELRAARRLGRGAELVVVIADCERALRRPAEALALLASVGGEQLGDPADRVEAALVTAGARLDLGEVGGALAVLKSIGLHPARREPWTIRLWYGYADALLAAGRVTEAAHYFALVAAADDDGETDAELRLAELD